VLGFLARYIYGSRVCVVWSEHGDEYTTHAADEPVVRNQQIHYRLARRETVVGAVPASVDQVLHVKIPRRNLFIKYSYARYYLV
jgi:hypothetical protein